MCLDLLTCGLACVAAYLQVENAAFDREAACVVPGMRGVLFPRYLHRSRASELATTNCTVCWWRFYIYRPYDREFSTLVCCVLGAAQETLAYEALALGRHGGEVTQFSALLVLNV